MKRGFKSTIFAQIFKFLYAGSYTVAINSSASWYMCAIFSTSGNDQTPLRAVNIVEIDDFNEMWSPASEWNQMPQSTAFNLKELLTEKCQSKGSVS